MSVGGQALRRGQHDRIAQRAAQAGLVALGQDVAADVDEHRQVAAQRRDRVAQALGDRRGSAVDVDQHRRAAQVRGHPRLREEHVAAAHPGVGPGEQDARGELPRGLDLVDAARAGHGIDRPALPGEPTQQRLGVVVEAHRLAGGQGADHVSPAAHPDHQGPARSP